MYDPRCIRMKPDWDLLAEHADESVFIADVNCREEEALCTEFHTGGTYPTILVFRQGQPPELYQGARGFVDMMEFVDSYLVVPCDLRRVQTTCNEKQQRYIAKWESTSTSALQKEISRLDALEPKDLTYELAKWRRQRLHILKQFVGGLERMEL